eukprot:442642-Prymnesium_polylepis.1
MYCRQLRPSAVLTKPGGVALAGGAGGCRGGGGGLGGAGGSGGGGGDTGGSSGGGDMKARVPQSLQSWP